MALTSPPERSYQKERWKLRPHGPIAIRGQPYGFASRKFTISLDQIAARHTPGMSWQELALYNWGTDVPREINWYLDRYVGCRKQTADGKNFLLTAEADPGSIWIPTEPLTDTSSGRVPLELPSPPLPNGAIHELRIVLPIEFHMRDDVGKPAAGATVKAIFAAGEEFYRVLDKDGFARIEHPPYGPCTVEVLDGMFYLLEHEESSPSLPARQKGAA